MTWAELCEQLAALYAEHGARGGFNVEPVRELRKRADDRQNAVACWTVAGGWRDTFFVGCLDSETGEPCEASAPRAHVGVPVALWAFELATGCAADDWGAA